MDTEQSDTPLSCLLSALTRLMTHYAMRPNGDNAAAVVRLLHALQAHPDIAGQPVLQNTCGRMLPHWQNLAVSRQQSFTQASLDGRSLH